MNLANHSSNPQDTEVERVYKGPFLWVLLTRTFQERSNVSSALPDGFCLYPPL